MSKGLADICLKHDAWSAVEVAVVEKRVGKWCVVVGAHHDIERARYAAADAHNTLLPS